MNARMEAADLAKFIGRAREAFRGEWDERIWEMSLSQIAELRPSLAMLALHKYAVRYGGERSRFIPGKFLEQVEELRQGDDEARARAKRQADRELAAIVRDEEQKRISQDWMDRRHEVEASDRDRLAEAVAFLVERGWARPRVGVDAWPRALVLAVADLVTDRRIDDRGRAVSAWEFWSIPERNPNGIRKAAIIGKPA